MRLVALRLNQFFKSSSAVLWLFCSALTWSNPAAQAATDFKQAANKSPEPGKGVWINAILQQNNSIYFEGISTLQRLVLVDIKAARGGNPDLHLLRFSHQASKSDTHAYDFLTSWEQAKSASIAIHGSDLFLQLDPAGPQYAPGVSESLITELRAGHYQFEVTAPDQMGSVAGDDVQARIQAYEQQFGNRVIRLYGNEPISTAELVFEGYSGGADQFAEYSLRWISASTAILVEMAGHLSVGAGDGIGYGPGRGSANISGGPYHFKLESLDGGALGSQDNQIKGADILAAAKPLACGITPSSQAICPGKSTQFAATAVEGGVPPFSYAWSGPNGFSASSQAINVSLAGEYILVITDATGVSSARCSALLSVHVAPDVSAVGGELTDDRPVIQLRAFTSLPTARYRWEGPGIVPSAASPTADVNQPGEYQVSVVDPLTGCSSSARVSVIDHRGSLPPSEPILPPSEPTVPPREPTLPPGEPTVPPSEPTMPPSQPTVPPTKPTLPPDEPTAPPSEPNLPPTEPIPASRSYCTFTQGFYGNEGGKFNRMSTLTLITSLLVDHTTNQERPIVLGNPDTRALIIPLCAARLIFGMLPAGGPSKPLDSGITVLGESGHRPRRLSNSLFAQTLTLALNLRLSPTLGDLPLARKLCTVRALHGPDHLLGTEDDIPDARADSDEFVFPHRVLETLTSHHLPVTVGGLLQLANTALAGAPIHSVGLSEIAAAADAINRSFDGGRFAVPCPAETDQNSPQPNLGSPDVAEGATIEAVNDHAADKVRIKIRTKKGRRCRLQVSTDLIHWTDLTQVASDGSTVELTEPATSTLRFYRVRHD